MEPAQKHDKDGKIVDLTDTYKKLINELREAAPRLIDALEDILAMLGHPDPNATLHDSLPIIEHFPDISQENLVKYTRLLIDAMTKIRDRDWNSTTWEDDYSLLTNPFGSEWHRDIWTGLHDLQIDVGDLVHAYRSIYHWGMFARREAEWPADRPDPRIEVEVIRVLANYTASSTALIREAEKIESGRESGWLTALSWLGTFAGGFGEGGVGGGGFGKGWGKKGK